MISIFTDGSSLGNPGPSGAGIWLRGPGIPGEQHSVALGWGDNNDGEMQAILLGLRRAVARASEFPSQDDSRLPLLLFSDSLGCLGYLLEGWRTAVDRRLARATRAAHREAKKHFDVSLIWVRGHARIPGNERADKLAKVGAKRARAKGLQRPAHTLGLALRPPPSEGPAPD